jgi:hypothetical protein
MRNYKTLVIEAELLAMSAEAVAQFLKSRATSPGNNPAADVVDEDTEQALRSRKHALIDLALAQYGRHVSVVAALFASVPVKHPIRLAALSNKNIQGKASFPIHLFGDEHTLCRWLDSAPEEEFEALFENSNLSNALLADLLTRRGTWSDVAEDTLRKIVQALLKNERMHAGYQKHFSDEWKHFNYTAVSDAAWLLAQTVEPTERWAAVLGWLYEKLEAEAPSIKKPLSLVPRWRVDASDKNAVTLENELNADGNLSHRQRMCKGLGRLALAQNGKLLPALLKDKDIALRCAVYASGRMTVVQLKAAFKRDGVLVFDEAIANPQLWQSDKTRAALWAIAQTCDKQEKGGFSARCERYGSVKKEMMGKGA